MSEPLRATCPNCECTVKVKPTLAGKKIKCPKCESAIAVPTPQAPRPAKAAAPPRSAANRTAVTRQSPTRRRKSEEDYDEFDLGTALEDIGEYEDLPDEDSEYEDYEVGSVRRKSSSKRSKVDASLQGVWRDGKIVVLAHGARLPKRCFKTNASDVTRKSTELAYTPAASTLIQIPLAILMTIFTGGFITFSRYKKVEVDIYYSKKWKQKRLLRIFSGIGIMVAGMAMIFFGLVDRRGLMALFGFVFMVGGLVFAGTGDHISAQKIDDRYVRLRGAGKRFLETLPDWRKSRG